MTERIFEQVRVEFYEPNRASLFLRNQDGQEEKALKGLDEALGGWDPLRAHDVAVETVRSRERDGRPVILTEVNYCLLDQVRKARQATLVLRPWKSVKNPRESEF